MLYLTVLSVGCIACVVEWLTIDDLDKVAEEVAMVWSSYSSVIFPEGQTKSVKYAIEDS